ncbi:hypothetical protein BN1221_01826 [Brenneria goodwinii]|uniref:Uncharacterized protein n=1 Tax=Brenneria goodwinii TaxID=1109412 RepID=A0A0G4JU26_9GAMM|nr:hypothetical protein BN1221_01826 [Brenneria goodwinii]
MLASPFSARILAARRQSEPMRPDIRNKREYRLSDMRKIAADVRLPEGSTRCRH